MDRKRANLTPAELQAIQEHKRRLAQERGTEVSIEDAIRDFLVHYAAAWRREKMRRDNEEQRQEIEKHKYFRSIEEQRDIGRAVAAHEWCEKFARIWRAERESLERNGFVTAHVVVATDHFHLRPASALGKLAEEFECDIYMHKPGIAYYNFMLHHKPYLSVKSILGFLSLGVAMGDTLEFIASGSHANQAIVAIAELMAKPNP